MPNRDAVEEFVQLVEQGKFELSMTRFYMDDATTQENNDAPRSGLNVLLERERQTLATFKTIRAQAIRPILIDGDRVAINWIFEFDHPAGFMLRLDEIAFQTWSGDKLASERFFYDPAQLQPPQASKG